MNLIERVGNSGAFGDDARSHVKISREAIAALPLGQFNGRIVLVETPADARVAVKILQRERVLGFDTETKPTFKRGLGNLPSLVQFAGEQAVYLFRLDDCGGVPPLFPIFSDPAILKAGVAVRDDVRFLKDRAPFKDAGFVEISEFTRRDGVENTGLRALAAHYLGMRISKGAQVSNWAGRQLTPQQITYAATDAWISRRLYLLLEESGLTSPAPHR
ncbi:MAG: 3'-5' exonuclease domain-containing protein 2 [Puniceicoccales bacterium]|jgi:ribonuclease D|nr:3'-5' exonuclease domain-containing protein 2 [Puniceicoccales bacterium]